MDCVGTRRHAGPLNGAAIETIDTAPTVLWLLGVRHPTQWDGSPITEAFQPVRPNVAD